MNGLGILSQSSKMGGGPWDSISQFRALGRARMDTPSLCSVHGMFTFVPEELGLARVLGCSVGV